MKCNQKGCDVELEFELSLALEMCRFCQIVWEPDWSDQEWWDFVVSGYREE